MSNIAVLQQQLDDVRAALRQARELIGVQVSTPPEGFQADPTTAREWVR